MSGILDTLYAERSTTKNPATLFEASSSLYRQLQSWLKALPPILKTPLSEIPSNIVSPHILALGALYHTLEVLLHRPFVSDGHLRSASLSATTVAFNTWWLRRVLKALTPMLHFRGVFPFSESTRNYP
ncbi:hypothetical protein EYZ11_007415 [Aspergillus tanneri]|uniref:Uncharacterized protein n=1 Tax=Aspergillus tanneri TaxID=1220188 RepID=A0A4S3JD12_9EURO|nr:hypothetical protein EYZ11_007415 [Aspergillus tanneri]